MTEAIVIVVAMWLGLVSGAVLFMVLNDWHERKIQIRDRAEAETSEWPAVAPDELRVVDREDAPGDLPSLGGDPMGHEALGWVEGSNVLRRRRDTTRRDR